MPTFRMKSKHIGDPDCPFESRYCPKCEAINWAVGRNPYNISEYEIDAIKCWKCKTVFSVEHDHAILNGFEEERATVCWGRPDPVLPKRVLQNIVDSADQNLKNMEAALEENPYLAGDPGLAEIMEELRKSVAYAKQVLHEGKLGRLVAPV